MSSLPTGGRLRAVLILSGFVLALPPAAARARDAAMPRAGTVSLHVPAGRLAEALAEISRRSGVQIVTSVPADLRIAHPVRGRFAVGEAIRQVTQGLPVAVRQVPGGYLVTPSAPTSLAASLAASGPVPPPDGQASPQPLAIADPFTQPIVVTGYRESLRQAMAVKRSARAILEATRAEDIAAFPDHNAADALQRLPGVAISRDNGEGRQISVRGLGPLFTRTTLNGIEALATTASGMDNRGSASRQRKFDYSVFDAGLFSGVEVRKTWSADRDAGGIGGTVALHTLRPFDRPGNVTLLSLQGRTSGDAGGVTPQLTAELSRRNDRWGALIAMSYSRNRVTEYGYRNWDWVPVTFGADTIGPGVSAEDRARLTGASGDPVYMSRGQTYSTWTNRFERMNLIAAFEHEDDDGLHLTLDLIHARLANHRGEYSLAAAGTNGLTSGTVDGTQVLNSVRIAGDTMVAADFSGVDMRSERKVTEDHTDFNQAVLALQRPLGESTRIEARLGYARSDFEEPVFDKVFLQSTGQSFSYVATGRHPHNRYAFDLADAGSWDLMRADVREDAIVNDNAAARLEVIRRLAPHIELRVGASFRHYGNDGYERRVSADYRSGSAAAATGLIDARSLARYVVADLDATFARIGQSRDLTAADDLPGTAYRVRENAYAAFALAQFDLTLGTLPLDAELGLQYLRMDTRSAGEASDDTTLVSVVQHSRHGAWLPSLQARLDLAKDLRLRFAANRNLNQPDVADLRAAASVNSTPFGGTVETGNPALRPFRATALDLSVERYMGRDGYASLGLFYKRMDSFITSETTVMAYSETGLPLAFLYDGLDGTALYNVVRPLNGKGASIRGAEAAIQRDLHFLPAPFDGLGVQANLTFAAGRSEVIYDGKAVQLPLIDLSRWSGNATLYYTGRGWDARLAAAWRGTYRIDIGNNGNIGEWIEGGMTLDFAAHLRVTAAMQASFEARNLTDAAITQYTDRDAHRLLARTRSGRIFALGLRSAF
ncbi:TonB-dependent receptor [Novosphingobium clariflavum]|uniref:TonB-dependent receptor n=1 Tax=Novosphingobium clariflavum TaxID=2029884 RepID=A0ABV6S6X8_9SPHN|nr:TonB-dependent receptor [Novosphingobium clariflavum]